MKALFLRLLIATSILGRENLPLTRHLGITLLCDIVLHQIINRFRVAGHLDRFHSIINSSALT